jgi:dTDP-4-amino-4,6-dideoxygalactose transaminase
MKFIPYGKQKIFKKDINCVVKSLLSERITQGKYINFFEKKISKILDVKYAVACSSGTSGLYLAFKAVNLKKNEIVIMPAINFVASFNVCKLMNARIYLADVDPATGQMTPETLLKCINYYKIKNIKAVLLMHLGGSVNNSYNFYALKKKYKFFYENQSYILV